MGQAQPTRLADDERLRVTVWRFAPGDSTGQHRHELDYAVVPVTGGTFDVTGPGGEVSEMIQERGVPYFRSAGALHDVRNTTDQEAVFVEVELRHEP
jgi:quercetin dioxygenase-like cupin family protein